MISREHANPLNRDSWAGHPYNSVHKEKEWNEAIFKEDFTSDTFIKVQLERNTCNSFENVLQEREEISFGSDLGNTPHQDDNQADSCFHPISTWHKDILQGEVLVTRLEIQQEQNSHSLDQASAETDTEVSSSSEIEKISLSEQTAMTYNPPQPVIIWHKDISCNEVPTEQTLSPNEQDRFLVRKSPLLTQSFSRRLEDTDVWLNTRVENGQMIDDLTVHNPLSIDAWNRETLIKTEIHWRKEISRNKHDQIFLEIDNSSLQFQSDQGFCVDEETAAAVKGEIENNLYKDDLATFYSSPVIPWHKDIDREVPPVNKMLPCRVAVQMSQTLQESMVVLPQVNLGGQDDDDRIIFHQDFISRRKDIMIKNEINRRKEISKHKQVEAEVTETCLPSYPSVELEREDQKLWSNSERKNTVDDDASVHDPNPIVTWHNDTGCQIHEGEDVSSSKIVEAVAEHNTVVLNLASIALQEDTEVLLDTGNENGSNDNDQAVLDWKLAVTLHNKDIITWDEVSSTNSWLRVDEEVCLKVNHGLPFRPHLLLPPSDSGQDEGNNCCFCHSTGFSDCCTVAALEGTSTPDGKRNLSTARSPSHWPSNVENDAVPDKSLLYSPSLKTLTKSLSLKTDGSGVPPGDTLNSANVLPVSSTRCFGHLRSKAVQDEMDSDYSAEHTDSLVSVSDNGSGLDHQAQVVRTKGNHHAAGHNLSSWDDLHDLYECDGSVWLKVDEEVSLKFHPHLSLLYTPQSVKSSPTHNATDLPEERDIASVSDDRLMDGVVNFNEAMQHQKTPNSQGGRGGGPGQNRQGQGQNRQGQGQNRQGQGQNRQGQGQNRQGQSSRQKVFEPYWSQDSVSQGIKRGQLFVGAIRINIKNYREAYVPQPDGLADVFIDDLEDRNRALNSDEIVVLPYALEKWRVNVEEYEEYRDFRGKELQPNHVSNDEDSKMEEGKCDSDGSGPDVIIKSDDDSKDSSKVASKDGDKSLKASSQGKKSAAKETPRQGQSSESKSPKTLTVAQVRQKFGHEPLAAKLFGNGLEKLVTPVSAGTSPAARFLQVTGRVVFIYERKHSRAASGHIKLMADKNRNLALFAPFDSRVPRIIIPMADCPKDFFDRPGDHLSTLFIARITSWEDNSKMPKGNLARSIGEAGQVEPETEAMLIEMDVDDSPFSDAVLACLPQDLPWSIPESEIASRKDLRSSCIFTIDPSTARDLDDAMSCEELGNGRYKVGVHIADVSYFVAEGTELDKVASQRATSVYLVQKVVPMLPRLLCEQLCSLNPDEDRLAFSVEWIINEEGEIFEEWYGRTIIRSCVKLSYEHAQGFIEEPEREWTAEELPPISKAFSSKDIVKRVLLLNKIAVALRKQRHDNGALRLDQVKLSYTLNKETGLPNGTFVYQQKDSNRLIEEFMLLANMAVAHRIKQCFPQLAILRRHPAPQVKPLHALEDLCEGLGLELNMATAGTVQESLRKYHGADEFSQARVQVLVALISKPMQNARYFCTGTLPDEAMYHHYALNVPLYTHFTSPIRRFADVMVHRLLAAAQDYSPPPATEVPELQKRASHCNDKKFNAKMASDRSSDMFFALYIKEAGQMEASGMVMAVLDKSFDVLILSLGVTKRVYLESLPLMGSSFAKRQKSPELTIEWAADEKCGHRTHHLITLFTMLDCVFYAAKEPLKWTCVIRRPKKEIKFVTEEEM